MFMTQLCLVPTYRAHVPLRNAAVSTSLALLLTVSFSCAREETGRAPATRPRRPVVEDAGRQCPPFDAAYRDQFKACSVDADCEVAEVALGCRGKRGVYGVATAERDAFDSCAPEEDLLPACSGVHPPNTRAEDGRNAAPDRHDVEVRCNAGSCQSHIGERQCGSADLVCTQAQVCVSFLNLMGLTQFTCQTNLCGNQPLDCECVGSVCVAAGEGFHTCAVEQVVDSDVFCKRELR